MPVNVTNVGSGELPLVMKRPHMEAASKLSVSGVMMKIVYLTQPNILLCDSPTAWWGLGRQPYAGLYSQVASVTPL